MKLGLGRTASVALHSEDCVVRGRPVEVLGDLELGDVFHLVGTALGHRVHRENDVHASDRDGDSGKVEEDEEEAGVLGWVGSGGGEGRKKRDGV